MTTSSDELRKQAERERSNAKIIRDQMQEAQRNFEIESEKRDRDARFHEETAARFDHQAEDAARHEEEERQRQAREAEQKREQIQRTAFDVAAGMKEDTEKRGGIF